MSGKEYQMRFQIQKNKPGLQLSMDPFFLALGLVFILCASSYSLQTISNAAKVAVAAQIRNPTGTTDGASGGINELLGKVNSGSMVNEFTGQLAFGLNLGGVAAQNGISYSLNLSYYGGGVDLLSKTTHEYVPGNWVGAGFNLKPPSISVSADNVFGPVIYYLSLDGVTQQEMVHQIGTPNFTLKNNPFIKITSTSLNVGSAINNRCPAGVSFSFFYTQAGSWIVTLPDGSQYFFGDEKNCSESNTKLCLPTMGRYFKYSPYYVSPEYKFPQVYFLSHIVDRQSKSAIWFNYNKVVENVSSSCNSYASTSTFVNSYERAIYLREIFSTNGLDSTNFKTSRIAIATATKTEEPVFNSRLTNPIAFYEDQKLTNIQYYENGILINSLLFNYGTASSSSRMILSNITAQEPKFLATRNILSLTYNAGLARISSLSDASGKIVEVNFGNIPADPISGTSPLFQELNFNFGTPDGLPPANTRVAYAKQFGDKFYVEVENTGADCSINSTDSKCTERLYQFESRGTFWILKHVFNHHNPDKFDNVNFFMSPDGKYFVWSRPNTTQSNFFEVWDLSDPPDANQYQVLNFQDFGQGGTPGGTQLFLYPDWFAAYNPGNTTHIQFYHKPPGGHLTEWQQELCGEGTLTSAASGIKISSYLKDSSNYSGENEFVNGCFQVEAQHEGLFVYPGPNYLVVNDNDWNITHLFAYDGTTMRDYVHGIETSHPGLQPFTHPAELPTFPYTTRPWARQFVGSFENNSSNKIRKIVASENFILMNIDGGPGIRYLLVLGFDGHQLRYLYDEPLPANDASGDINNEIDFAAGPDYFIVKNQSPGAPNSLPQSDPHPNPYLYRGYFFYHVDLKTWSVNKTILEGDYTGPTNNIDVSHSIIKAFQDYLIIETGSATEGSYSPILTRDGVGEALNSVGNPYDYNDASRVYVMNTDRYAVPMTDWPNVRTAGPNGSQFKQTNMAALSSRLLGVDLGYRGANESFNHTGHYNVWSKVGSANQMFERRSLFVSDPPGVYHSAQLVSGGVVVTQERRSPTDSTFQKMYFYPDPLNYVTSAPGSALQVPGSSVVSSVVIKSNGSASTGNQLQQIKFTYPITSPDGATTNHLINFSSGVPNFKYVQKEFAEGAQVSEFVRDEFGSPLSKTDQTKVGSQTQSWSLPDKVTYKKPGGTNSNTVQTAVSDPLWQVDATLIRKWKDTTNTYFYNSRLPSSSYLTNYDLLNGQPKITVAKVAGKFNVSLSIFAQDLPATSPLPPANILRQTATFQFATDPCTDGSEDHCKNLSLATFNSFTPDQKKSIISSTIYVYDNVYRLQDVYQWQPATLGTVYPPLNGDPTPPAAGSGWTWLKVSSVTKRQDNAVARCKSDLVTESNQLGVYTTHFYGGNDCYPIGTVSNSPLFSTALLNGEEEINTANCPGNVPCMGAFGRWQANGSSMQQDPATQNDPPKVVHTGNNAVKVTAINGPTIDLQLRQSPGFFESQKGYMVSVWMFAKPNSNPAAAIEFWQRAAQGSTDTRKYTIDLMQEYIAANGSFPTNRWVKLQRLISYSELSSQGVFLTTPSNDYLRVWFGKSSSANTNPVYVDDARLYPANASVTATNFDSTGLVSSTLDQNNEPTFLEYDVWRNPVGARNKDGILGSSSTTKLFGE